MSNVTCGITGKVIPPEDAGGCNNAEGCDDCPHNEDVHEHDPDCPFCTDPHPLNVLVLRTMRILYEKGILPERINMNGSQKSAEIGGSMPVNEDKWQHRSAMMKCMACMYYVPKESLRLFTPGNGVGRCRRHAPTTNGWVVVREGDWCGDHKLDENKA
jgi:hypothetical protein